MLMKIYFMNIYKLFHGAIDILDIDNVDDKITLFNGNMTLLMDIHAPLKTCIFKKLYK